jgi:hypothetical protein
VLFVVTPAIPPQCILSPLSNFGQGLSIVLRAKCRNYEPPVVSVCEFSSSTVIYGSAAIFVDDVVSAAILSAAILDSLPHLQLLRHERTLVLSLNSSAGDRTTAAAILSASSQVAVSPTNKIFRLLRLHHL